MISKTSWFNKGIYKSNLRRYLWGSILYFIVLFVSTGMMILLNEDPLHPSYYYGSVDGKSTILQADYMIFPMLLSVVVPTIAGLLIFRYIHSKKAAVFTHSLPVKRSANYISSVLAAFTLMAVPIVLNAIILAIMSISAYSLHFTIGDCITWMLLNLLGIFTMFSAVCFVSVITGNSFAMVGLNILFHTIGLIISASFSMVCQLFLHGFAGEAMLIDKVFNNIFITRIPTIMTSWGHSDSAAIKGYSKEIVAFVLVSVIIYIIAGILYSKRKMETAEDVAGFKCLNYVFKYLVTFIAAVTTFATLAFSIYNNPTTLFVIVFVVSTVVYFGSEMLLKKSFRVWKSYKGYIGFLAFFAAMMCLFAFTNFFGFETYIPEKEDVKSVAIYEYYGQEVPSVSKEAFIAEAICIHSERIADKGILAQKDYSQEVSVEYTLKNGRKIYRSYFVEEDEYNSIMNRLYHHLEYKTRMEEIFTPMKDIAVARLVSNEGKSDVLADKEQMKEFVECLKKDIEALSYSQINSGGWSVSAEIQFEAVEDMYKELTDATAEDAEKPNLQFMHVSVNMNYENTIAWLKKNGYTKSLEIENRGTVYIARHWDRLPIFNEEARDKNEGREDEIYVKYESNEARQKLINFAKNTPLDYIPQKERFAVYLVFDELDKDYYVLTDISCDQLKELFPEKDWENVK